MFAGALGHAYGHHAIWSCWDSRSDPNILFGDTPRPSAFWHQVLGSEGAKSIAHLRKLIDARPFMQLVPDQGLVAVALFGAAHIRAARGQAYAYIYSATGQSSRLTWAASAGLRSKCTG
jgi:hypothetical protein